MSRQSSTLVAAAGLAALVLGAAGCGVPTEATPRLIAESSAPSVLLPPEPTDPHSTPSTPDARAPRLYFVDDHSRLVSISRATPTGTPRTALAALMRELGGGLTEDERDRGLSSALPPGMTLTVDDLHDGQATINLSGDVQGPSGDQTVLAVAQVVLSATTVPTVTSVRLTRSGAPLEAPLVGGALTSDPLVRKNYQPLLR